MARALSNPQVLINDVTYAIVPNTFTFTSGDGETNVRAASAGGGSITTVHSENAETQIGKMMFELYPFEGDIVTLRSIKLDVGNNVVKFSERTGDNASFSGTMTSASLMNDPEISVSADGTFSLEFMGDPIQFN